MLHEHLQCGFGCGCSAGQASQKIISANYGAGNFEITRKILTFSILTTVFFRMLRTALSMSVPNLYIKVFMSPSPEILNTAPKIMGTYALSFMLLPFNIFSIYYFQAIIKQKAAGINADT